jgi:hypothetical protein
MRKVAAVVLWSLASSVAQTFIPNASPSPNVSVPVWSNGWFVQFTHTAGNGDRPRIWAYDEKAQQVIRPTEIWFPDTASARIHAVAVTPDHKLVVAVLMRTLSNGMETRLCFIGPSGTERTVPTEGFIAAHLQYSPDGILWGFGYRAVESLNDREGDARLVRRFQSDGRELSATVRPLELLNPKNSRLNAGKLSRNGASFLLAGSARKFLFNSTNLQFAELDNDGKLLRVAALTLPRETRTAEGKQKRLTSAVITPRGKIYIGFSGEKSMWQLDPDTFRWIALDPSLFDGKYAGLYGSEGERVIIATGESRYAWFSVE